MLIACVQTDVTFADVSANVQRVLDWLEQAGRAGADLVILPECMLSGYAYDSRTQALPHALSIDDPLFNDLAKAASNHGLYLTLGFLEQDGDRLFNASALVGPGGVIGHYRKIHLPHLGIDRFVDRGDIPYRVLSAGDVKVGLAICYDSSFPEPMRLLALEGADVIALGTNWPDTAARTAEVVPPARSMENHLVFCRGQSCRRRKWIRILRSQFDLRTGCRGAGKNGWRRRDNSLRGSRSSGGSK